MRTVRASDPQTPAPTAPLWFWKGETIVGKKPKEAMGNFGRITSVKDLPSAAKIEAYVKKAVSLITPAPFQRLLNL
jgi:hypothetical protein